VLEQEIVGLQKLLGLEEKLFDGYLEQQFGGQNLRDRLVIAQTADLLEK